MVSYVPGLAQHDASKPTEATKWGYTLSDSQNSRLLVDGAGTLGHRWEWKPFGETRADVGSTSSPFTFGGEQKDDETGLINLRARYYDPAIGRFLSRDSLTGAMTLPQSWNRYSYVENDPINHLDPSGHKKKKIKWPGGQDPDDDSHLKKKAKKCKNPGQYTGSCKGGPPNAAYAADGEAQHEAKKAGQAAAAGNLAAAAAHLQAAAHFASIAGTSAASTATMQAYASIIAAIQAIQAAHRVDNQSPTNNSSSASFQAMALAMGADPDEIPPPPLPVERWELIWHLIHVPSEVYRGDSRGPVEIFRDGFVAQGSSTDLMVHFRDPSNSSYISTSRLVSSAMEFATYGGVYDEGWVYVVYLHPSQRLRSRDVNGEMRSRRRDYKDHEWEEEIAVAGPIPGTHVSAAHRVIYDRVTGRTVPTGDVRYNPNYQP